ncbi:MAG TPA: cytochrome d ubiquinol oxidase subunit II, partial [Gaiellales bacterium]
MTLDEVPLVILLLGLVAYAVLAGADFGAGFWQVTPGGGERERRIRDHARHAITPVWEANHVWLILVLTVCWTCYPGAFAAIASTLAAPLTIAALGIVLRATAYVLRSQTDTLRAHRTVERLFAISSIIVPFSLGAAVGGIASGRVPPGNARGDLITSWVNATSIAVGALAVVSTAYISAVWLAADARRDGDDELVEAYRTRALAAAVVAAPNVEVWAGARVRALIQDGEGRMRGALVERDGRLVELVAPAVVLAAGGLGGLYAVTTNPPAVRGEGLGLAALAGAAIADPEFVQFHPTAIDLGLDPSPLASEALRGEGAVLVGADGERFMGRYHPAAEL